MSLSSVLPNLPKGTASFTNWIAYIAFRLLLLITSLIPLHVNRAIGRQLGYGYYKFFKKRVHYARVNMNICFPELSAEDKEFRIKESLAQAGMWFMEAGAIWLWPREKILQYVKVANQEVLDNAIHNNHGVILAVPHIGNWEIMGPLVTRDHEFACFYQVDDSSPLIGRFIFKQRSRNGVVMAPANPSGVRILFRHLKQGKIAGILPDHIPTDEMGVFAPFYSRDALTGTLISSLAKKNHAVVLLAAVIRTDAGFTVHYEPVEDQESDDPVAAATGINRAIEKAIELAPAQFQWVYPRFKKRPKPVTTQSPYR